MRDVIHTIYDILDRTSPKEIRFLKETDPFRFLCQVVLSAQTTDEAVNEVSKQLFTLFPDRHSLAVADPADVERVIHRLGFFRAKAKHLIALANALDGEDILGIFPGFVRFPGWGARRRIVILVTLWASPRSSWTPISPGWCDAWAWWTPPIPPSLNGKSVRFWSRRNGIVSP